MTIRTYTSPLSFKQALEKRLRTAAHDGATLVRKRQLLVFEARAFGSNTHGSPLERHAASMGSTNQWSKPPRTCLGCITA